jgi:hypothetical protein
MDFKGAVAPPLYIRWQPCRGDEQLHLRRGGGEEPSPSLAPEWAAPAGIVIRVPQARSFKMCPPPRSEWSLALTFSVPQTQR